MSSYQIVIFRNKVKKKVLKKYKTFSNSEKEFNNLVNNNNVHFEIKYENNKESKYEIALVCENCNTEVNLFNIDEMGRNIEVKTSDTKYKILRVSHYSMEEKIQDYQQNKRITFEEFLNLYCLSSEFKNIFTLNNKLFIQIDETFYSFVLKCTEDAERLLDTIEFVFEERNISNYISFNYKSSSEKKWIYGILQKNGYNKSFLYKQFINYPKKSGM